MGATERVKAYPVTGASGPVYPSSAALPNEYAEWGYCGFSLVNLSIDTSYRVILTDETATMIHTLDLEPGESRSDWMGPQGITFSKRLNVTFIPATATNVVVGSVWVG